jgi:hypothetical protein
LANCILTRIGKLAQAIQQPQSLQHRRINTDAYSWIAGFYPLQGSATGKGPFGNYRHRKPAA